MMWFFYEILLIIGFFLYLPRAIARRRLPHRGWSMRLGRYPTSVVNALQGRRTVWVHAVSVGEVLGARPLLTALAQALPAEVLALSTITRSGFEVAAKQMAGHGVTIYFPLDLRLCVARALHTLRPRLLLLMESELWPMTIRLAKARGIPIAVVNGRISPRAFSRYQLVRPVIRGMVERVDLFLMQSQVDADRIRALGAAPEKVRVVGSLKWDASLGDRPTPDAIQAMAGRLGLSGQEIVVMAGSTHRGEEVMVLRAYQALRASHQRARLILAPRYLERLAEVEGLVRQAGFTPVRLSHHTGGEKWQIGIVDVFGQLPLYYGLATVVFIGGSFIPHGGQNPLEACSVGKPVVFGPSMYNFETIAHQLLAHHAARQAASEDELTQFFAELIDNQAEAHAMGRRAQALTEQFQGATQRTLDALQPLLKNEKPLLFP